MATLIARGMAWLDSKLDAATGIDDLVVTTPFNESFVIDATISRMRADEVQEASGDIVKVLRTTAIVSTEEMLAYNVTELQRNATFAALGYFDWALDLRLSEWGPAFVKLELIRYPITSHAQMESHASV